MLLNGFCKWRTPEYPQSIDDLRVKECERNEPQDSVSYYLIYNNEM